jgi:hypothetical protein
MLTSLAQTIAPSIDPAFWTKFGIVSVKYAHASSLTCALIRCAAHRRHLLGLLMGRILMRSFFDEECRQSPTCVLMQIALKEFTFGVRHDEMLDDTFLCLGIVVQEEV